MSSTKVIIIGVSHHNTYGMLKCFGEYGVMPILILYGCDKSYILHSKYISESFVVKDECAAINLLSDKADKWKGCLIISCTDAIASVIDLKYDELKDYYHVFNCGQAGRLTYFMNKLIQTDCAKKIGFDVPESVEGSILEIGDCRVPYPRIIKPVESIHGGKKISICHNEDEFKQSISRFGLDDKVIVQQFVEKDYEIVIVGASLHGEICLPAYVHKHRDEKGGTTFSTIKSFDKLPPHLLTTCKKLIEEMNYQGLFGIELINKEDKYFFIEINLRNDATTYGLAKAGANLPLAIYESITQGSQLKRVNIKREIQSIVEFPDFIHVLRRTVSPITWYKQLKNSSCRYFYSKEDKKPYRIYKKEFIQFLVKHAIKLLTYASK